MLRAVARLMAWMVAMLTGMAATFALLAALASQVTGGPSGADCAECTTLTKSQAQAVVVGRVMSRFDDYLTLDVAIVERGDASATEVVRTFGVDVAPWRQYRFYIYDLGGTTRVVNDQVPAEPLGFTVPHSVEAFSALPIIARLGIFGAPALVISLSVIILDDRRSIRRQAEGSAPSVARAASRRQRIPVIRPPEPVE